ncbi:hypothetical protein PQE66_gp035 [Bacillus phage PBC2]|uniref:Uncharacterized protein n=1 Tax=Bacillus phage PBC2 TaxID=1675029 RepID=A0A218KBS9_9CAUD|nr:hypothetical protein PQE66_gp035 [Bacillus phage PBC2]AKQ08350.1 hypothetical protein PBC2_035 [Bacillus phage PBC2]
MEVRPRDRAYFEKLDWEEVPMWKALKIWANNEKHVKCVEGSSYSFYHGQEKMNIRQSQVKNGKWYVQKM